MEIIKLNKSHYKQILKLENSSLEEDYHKSSDENPNDLFENYFFYGIFIDNNLIAFAGAYKIIPIIQQMFFAEGLNKLNKKITDLILFENVFVHNDFRGRGIHKLLRSHIMKEYPDKSFLSTVYSTKNISNKNIQELGFKLISQEKIENKRVNLYYLE